MRRSKNSLPTTPVINLYAVSKRPSRLINALGSKETVNEVRRPTWSKINKLTK